MKKLFKTNNRMKTKRFGKISAFLIAVVMCAASFTACAGNKEAKYLEAFDKLEQRDYEAAYSLFVELGNYKDAEKEVAKFHYAPINHIDKDILEEGTETTTTTFFYDENNLISRYVIESEEYGSETGICTYDEHGRLTSISSKSEDGFEIKREYSYAADGNLIKEITTYSDGYFYSYENSFDEDGIRTKVVFEDPEGKMPYDCIHNEDGQISKFILKDDGGNVVSIEEYFYDENGQNVKIDCTKNGEIDSFYDFTYNEAGHLIREYHEDKGEGEEEDFSYTSEYTNDEHGNIIKDHTKYNDNTEWIRESSFKLVYVPFEYSEEDWKDLIDDAVIW